MERHVETPEEMQAFAREYVSALSPRARAATIVGISGELGAGKTTLAQGIAKALGVEETVTSPTFVIEKIYALSGQKFSRLVHIDAYRLKSAHELEALGWYELLRDPANLVLLEWPEKVEGAIPRDAKRITLKLQDEHARTISYDGQK